MTRVAGQPSLRVEYVPTDELAPYAGNAKEHPEWQVGQIANSIERFGFDDPVGAWHDQDGRAVIVEGHGRVLAARRIGLATVPVVWLDHMDDEGRRAYGLVHNKLTMDTPWDDDALAAEVETLKGIDMSDFGVTLGATADSPAEAAPDGDSPEVETVRFTLAPEQREYVMSALRQADTSGTETYGNPNGNGNALYEVVVEWQARRTSSSE
jgi:ParB-like chromosome segregation protein Spo0J